MTEIDLPFGTILHDFDDEYVMVIGPDDVSIPVLSLGRGGRGRTMVPVPIRRVQRDLIDVPWDRGRRRYVPLIGA